MYILQFLCLNWTMHETCNKKEILSIEMQVSHLFDYRCRTLFYGGRLVNSSLQSGQSYDKMKKSIVASIIQNKLFPKEIGCHSIFDVREQKTGHRLCDRLEKSNRKFITRHTIRQKHLAERHSFMSAMCT